MSNWLFFLVLSLLCVLAEGFFAAFEMASVSFNRVRLQYYVSKNKKSAKLLKYLLDKPHRLFGTTLIAVNTVLQIGSESARRFYEAMGLSPDLAPISQIIIVIIFGELAPAFAARRHSENAALIAVPFVYVISKILTPFTFIISLISNLANRAFKGSKKEIFFLTKDEIKRAFEESGKNKIKSEEEKMNNTVNNIFNLKNLKAKQIITSLSFAKLVSSQIKVNDLRPILKNDEDSSFIVIYHHFFQNVVAITYPTDLLKAEGDQRVINYSKPPWFVTENTSILKLLFQFRYNNQQVAIVIAPNGTARGIITLDSIIDNIFGDDDIDLSLQNQLIEKKTVILEKTISGDMLLSDFNQKYNANLEYIDAETISDLLCDIAKHHPSKGEILYFDQFEFTVEEPSLLGIKKVSIKTLQ
jgi:putative hemolysin